MHPSPHQHDSPTETTGVPGRFAAALPVLNELAVIALFLALALAVSWPLARNMTTAMTGTVTEDQLHALWLLANFRDWVLGNASLFHTTSLYHPYGTTLLLDGVGPLSGLFALPFWHAGPVAAFNGTVLVGFTLSGYCMYLFARGVGLSRATAFFSGATLLLSAPHMVSLYGHLERTFVGLPALVLLGVYHSLNPRRSRWWMLFASVMLLLCALYTASQLVFAGFAAALWATFTLLLAGKTERGVLLRRAALLGACVLIVVGPYVVAVLAVARDPAYLAVVARHAAYYSPDVAQFVVPNSYSKYLGWLQWDWRENRRHSEMDIAIETAVGVSLTALLLTGVALRRDPARVRPWVLSSLCMAVIALGPSLRVLGNIVFSVHGWPVILPYALLARVPGLNVMRVPGRFMIVGMVTIAIAAGIGLQSLTRGTPRFRRWAIVAAALVLMFLEQWPRPWPQWDVHALFPVSSYYERMARDPGAYAVLDLPAAWPPGDTTTVGRLHVSYQWYQLTHRKPIAWGYLSRSFVTHPIPLLRALTSPVTAPEGRIEAADGDAMRQEMQRLGYRYVVWHKTVRDMPGVLPTRDAIAMLLGPDTPPVFEDDLVRVFELSR